MAGWNPARRKPSKSSNAAAATITVTSTAVPARPMTNASDATAASTAPVMMRVVRSSPDGVTRGVAVTCGASVSSSMVGNCDPAAAAAAPRLRARAGFVRLRRAGAVRDGPRPRPRTPRRRRHRARRRARPCAVVSSWTPSSLDEPSLNEKSVSSQSPSPERKRGCVRGGPDLFVTRFVGDHRHLSSGRFGPVRQRHRTRSLADGAVAG